MITFYYIADVIVALSLPIFFYVGYRKGVFSAAVWKLYWLGCIIGLTWEIPIYLSGPEFQSEPFIRLVTEFPGHPILHPLLHTLWDGGLFLAGYWLTLQLCKAPILQRFSWRELGVMMVWGQLSELAVEVSATSVGAWTFADKAYNPVLFDIGHGSITLIPQLIWLAAPVVFYLTALAVMKREGIRG